jgi:hypothetical protein
MNKLSILSLAALLVFAASCKKADYLPTTTPATTAASATSPWKSLSGWQSKNYDKTTVFSSSLSDSTLSAQVVSKGLVLAYKKTGTTIHALPFSEKVAGVSYQWFYQVKPGGLQISTAVQGSSAVAPSTDHSLVYFVITAEQLSRLEGQGKTKAQLMNLSFEEAQALLK